MTVVAGVAGGVLGGLLASGLRAELPSRGEVSVRFEPSSFAEDASWATVTSWQGGGLEVTELKPVRLPGGGWRSDRPVPIGGEWKSMLRVQTGREIASVPVFLPADEAIPAPEVPAPGPAGVTREVVSDKEVLQREAKTDVAGWLWAAATGLIGLMYLTFLCAIALGVGRVGRAGSGRPGGESVREPVSDASLSRSPRPRSRPRVA